MTDGDGAAPGTGSSTDLAALAERAHRLAGPTGVPEAVQALADRLSEATCGSVLYEFGATLSVALGDLAAALEAAARRSGD